MLYISEFKWIGIASLDDKIIITSKKFLFDLIKHDKILVNNLSESYNILVNELFSHDDNVSFRDEFNLNNGSYISKFADLDNSVILGKNCSIGRGVKIGSNTIIKDNVVIKNAIIGSNVIISENSTIGSTGFGFDFKTFLKLFKNIILLEILDLLINKNLRK